MYASQSVLEQLLELLSSWQLVLASLLAACLVLYLITYCKNRKHKECHDQTNITQNIVAGPVYEEVSTPKESIELETNQAYGPVRQ